MGVLFPLYPELVLHSNQPTFKRPSLSQLPPLPCNLAGLRCPLEQTLSCDSAHHLDGCLTPGSAAAADSNKKLAGGQISHK